jgi:hypothetical protein
VNGPEVDGKGAGEKGPNVPKLVDTERPEGGKDLVDLDAVANLRWRNPKPVRSVIKTTPPTWVRGSVESSWNMLVVKENSFSAGTVVGSHAAILGHCWDGRRKT